MKPAPSLASLTRPALALLTGFLGHRWQTTLFVQEALRANHLPATQQSLVGLYAQDSYPGGLFSFSAWHCELLDQVTG